MPFLERIQSGIISAAAWIQNSFFEPEKCVGKYIQYIHTGQIRKSDEMPELIPGTAVWQLEPNNTYTRIPLMNQNLEGKQLKLPLIQVVVQVSKLRKRRGRTVQDGSNQINYDITSEMTMFHGEPSLDWLHVGLCVAHRYGVKVAPGEYSLSIIDGRCGLHSLSREEAAVFSLSTRANERGSVTEGQVESPGQSDSIIQNINDRDVSNSDGLIASSKSEAIVEINEWSEPEPEDANSDVELGGDKSGDYDSDPEPDFNE